MAHRPRYRRRPDGVLELRRGRWQLREPLRSAAIALAGIAVAVTVAAGVGWRVGNANPLRTRFSVCWNWSAGVPTGCWTR